MKQKRCALYARVSTSDKGQDVEMQLRELREFAKLRGFGELIEYVDEGFSGTTSKRPGLQKLLKDARQRKVDVILVWKLDRFARSLRELINMISDLSELGADFVSLKDALDLSTSQGRLMLHMVGAFAQFESDLIRTRVKAGLEHARSKGKTLGRPKIRSVVLDARIKLMSGEGLSMRKIADKLKISKGSVQRALGAWTKKPAEKLLPIA